MTSSYTAAPPVHSGFFRFAPPTEAFSDAFQKLVFNWYVAYRDFVTPVSRSELELSRQFAIARDAWKNETMFVSSSDDIERSRWYREIIAMGPEAVPLILDELEQEPGHWFAALTEITGEDPVPRRHRGNMKAMTKDWLAWGRKKCLIPRTKRP